MWILDIAPKNVSYITLIIYSAPFPCGGHITPSLCKCKCSSIFLFYCTIICLALFTFTFSLPFQDKLSNVDITMVAGSLFFHHSIFELSRKAFVFVFVFVFLFVIVGQYDDTHAAPIQQLKIWFIELPVLLRKKIRKKVFWCFCELSKYRFRVNIDFVNLARLSYLQCFC